MVKEQPKPERLNLAIPPRLAAKLNHFALKVANKKGKMPRAIKPQTTLYTLEKFLDENMDNPKIYDDIVEANKARESEET